MSWELLKEDMIYCLFSSYRVFQDEKIRLCFPFNMKSYVFSKLTDFNSYPNIGVKQGQLTSE